MRNKGKRRYRARDSDLIEEIEDERHSHQSEAVEDEIVKFKPLHELDPSSGSERGAPFEEKSVNLDPESATDLLASLKDDKKNFSPGFGTNQRNLQDNGKSDLEPVPNTQDYSMDKGDKSKMPKKKIVKKSGNKKKTKTQKRFDNLKVDLDKSMGRKTKYKFGNKVNERMNVVHLDGESPYAEYLPARFKQYIGKEALEHEKNQHILMNQSKVQFMSKMSDMASVYKGYGGPMGMRSERPMSIHSGSERGSFWQSPTKGKIERMSSIDSPMHSKAMASRKQIDQAQIDSFVELKSSV